MIIVSKVKEKVGFYKDVDKEYFPEDQATGTVIRWLISERDGAPTFAMRYITVEKGGHINSHKHPWEHEIFILKGSGEVRIGSEIYKMSEGYFIYIPPNVEHEYWNKGEDTLEFLCMIPNKPSVPEE